MLHKHLVLILFSILLLSCNRNNDNGESACLEAIEHISFETPAFTGTFVQSWLEYSVPGTGPTVVGDRLGWINWDYPSNPGIVNTIIFEYPNSGLTVGEYPALQVYGLTSYTSPTESTVIVCDEESCDNFIIDIEVLNANDGYACGTFSGELLDETGAVIEVEGDFKCILNP